MTDPTPMVKRTVRIQAPLYAEAEAWAHRLGSSVNFAIQDLLRRGLKDAARDTHQEESK